MNSFSKDRFAAALAHRRALACVLLLSMLAVGCSKQDESSQVDKQALLTRAQNNYAANDLLAAERDYRAVLRTSQDDPVALRQLGLLYVEQGQLPLAVPFLKQAAERQPDDLEVQKKIGTVYLMSRDFPRAREAALKVIEKEPGQEDALILLADTSVTPELIDESRKLLEEMRDKDKDRAGYHVALGLLDFRQRKPDDAEREFKKAIELEPKSIAALTALGTLSMNKNNSKQAGELFKAAAEGSSRRSPAQLRYVDFLIATGQTAEAKTALEALHKEFPSFLPPRVYLMRLACADKQDENCTSRVQEVLGQNPTNFDALHLSGNISLAKGDATQAIRAYQQAITLNGPNAPVLYDLARAQLLSVQNDDPVGRRRVADTAEQALTAAVKLDPNYDRATLLLAELKIRKGSAAAAVELLAPLVRARPQVAEAHTLLAAAYLAQQNRDEAIKVYRRASELFPKNPQLPFLAGRILAATGQLQPARQEFEKSLQAVPDFAPGIESLVNLDLLERKFSEATERTDRQIEKNPTVGQWWGLRGKIAVLQREYDKAEQDLLKAVELDPELEAAYELLARVYLTTNRVKQAIEKLTAFTEKKKTVPALMLLASMQHQVKDYGAAKGTYEKLLSISANYPLALNNLAVLYSEEFQQPDKAYELAKKARDAAPNHPNIADTFGWILFKRGEFREALTLLRDSASKLPDEPEAQFHLALAHYVHGEEALARASLQKVTEAKSEAPYVAEARRRLAFLNANSTSESDVQAYLRDYPNDPVATVRLAGLREKAGDDDGAAKMYEKVIADYPVFAPAIRQLALLYGRRPGELAKGFELAVQARQLYPNDPEITKALGIATFKRENAARARELLAEAATKRPDDPELLYYLGQTYRSLNRMPECKQAVERALGLNLSGSLVADAQKALTDCSEAAPQ
jgi:tetratricopeptide (TPR) repeat protein